MVWQDLSAVGCIVLLKTVQEIVCLSQRLNRSRRGNKELLIRSGKIAREKDRGIGAIPFVRKTEGMKKQLPFPFFPALL